jgi:hypothetical protein
LKKIIIFFLQCSYLLSLQALEPNRETTWNDLPRDVKQLIFQELAQPASDKHGEKPTIPEIEAAQQDVTALACTDKKNHELATELFNNPQWTEQFENQADPVQNIPNQAPVQFFNHQKNQCLLNLQNECNASNANNFVMNNIPLIYRWPYSPINLNQGIDTPQENYGATPLMYVALRRQRDLTEKLIANGADVNAHTRIGTALHYAPDADISELLIEHGAQINDNSFGGLTPIDVAYLLNQPNKFELLSRHGARPNQFLIPQVVNDLMPQPLQLLNAPIQPPNIVHEPRANQFWTPAKKAVALLIAAIVAQMTIIFVKEKKMD